MPKRLNPKPLDNYSAQSTVPPKYAQPALDMLAEGKTQKDVHRWLTEVEGYTTLSYSAVNRFCLKARQEKSNLATAIYAEALSKSAVDDMGVLNENTMILRRIRDNAVEAEEYGIAIRACGELKSTVALKMGVAGGSSTEDYESIEEDLIARITKKERKETN